MLKQLLFTLLILGSVFQLFGQEAEGDYFVVTGRFSSGEGTLDGATISITKNDDPAETITPPRTGKFRFELDFNNEYKLLFQQQGCFPKTVIISTYVPQDVLEQNSNFPPFQFVVNLFQEIPGIDKSFTGKPVARVFYNAKIDNFDSEIFFSDIQLEEQIEEAISQNADLASEQKGINKANAQEQAAMEKEYDSNIAAADAAYQKKEFKEAYDKFKAANAIFPDRPYPKDRMAELGDLLAAMQLAQAKLLEAEKNYQSAISDGDKLFGQERFDEAAIAYQRALDIKTTDNYAANKLAESKQKATEKEIEIQYNDLIAKGDNAYNGNNLEQARELYNQAVAVKPQDSKYAADQIKKIEDEIARQNALAEKERQYNQAITQGNQAFENKQYQEALAAFNQALGVMPNDQVAQNRINETNQMIALIETENSYNQAISRADQLFGEGKLEEAKQAYNSALAFMPNEKYPKDRVAEIDRQIQFDRQFENLQQQASSAFNSKDYRQALSFYQELLNMKPDDEQAQNRINEINQILSQQELDNRYTTAIAAADQAFNKKQYEQAKNSYNNALSIKPDEVYPKTQIQLIENEQERLAAQAETERQYNEAMDTADKALRKKNYEEAIGGYQAALSFKPEDPAATEKLNQANQLLLQQTNENNYKQQIAAADVAFNNQELENAKNLYQKALEYLPNESYPVNQIALIDQQIAKQNQFDSTMAQANTAFDAKNYTDAKSLYQQALAINNDAPVAKNRIAEIDQILAQQQLDKQYTQLISQADASFEAKDYAPAKNFYQQALALKSTETYPQQQISKIDQEVARLQALAEANEKAYQEAMDSGNYLMQQESFDEARQSFTEAKRFKPEETLPDEMIARVDSLQRAKEQALAEAKAREAALKLELDQKYAAAIKEGDRLYNQKELELAKVQYETAASVKPDEQYPKQQIATIEGELARLAKLNEAYNTAIAEANRLAEANSYREAKSKYEEALRYKPEEEYPKRQILRLDEILAQIETAKQIDAAYQAGIKKADSLFNIQAYQPAKDNYIAASSVKPAEIYPKEKIRQIDAILAEQLRQQQQMELTQKAFDDAIAKADLAFKNKNWTNARLGYEEALSLKPEESYPKTQLSEIERLAAEEIEQAYQAAIAKADGLFNQEKLAEAKPAYQEALKVKAGDTYALGQIDLINQRLDLLAQEEEARQKQDNDYRAKLALAESAFNNQLYPSSKDYYQQALALKPQEQYPADQIKRIDEIMAEQERLAELNQQYQQVMADAQEAFMQNQLQQAIDLYKNALTLKPDETLPKQRIADIEKMIARQEELARLAAEEEAQRLAVEKANQEKYDAAIAKAEEQYKNEYFAKAKDFYAEALDIFPDEQYPKDKIAEIDNLIEARALADMAQKQQAYQDSIFKAQTEAYNLKIAQAENHVTNQQLNEAIADYREAILIMPEKAAEVNEKINQLQNQLRIRSQQDERYQQTIALADNYYNQQDWNSALASYQEAASIKPDESYPKERIRTIQTTLKDRDDRYTAAISQADNYFNSSDWLNAKDKYTEALSIKKNESYPSTQLILVNQRIREEQEKLQASEEKEKSYQDAITKGDQAFAANQLTAAKTQFEFASNIKPEETYPRNKIAEIDRLLAQREQQAAIARQQNETDDKYRQAITLADNSFKQESYQAAKLQYQEALNIKPEEVYPRTQIDRIDQLLSALSEPVTMVTEEKPQVVVQADSPKTNYTSIINTKNEYNELIKAADESYLRKDYTVAQFYYYKAKAAQPQNPYPQQRIKEISQLIDQSLRSDQVSAYNDAIRQADKEFADKNYGIARFYYNKALETKSWEQYPKDQILEIRRLTRTMLSQREEEEYNNLISLGDEAFYNHDLAVARAYYQRAISYKTDEQYASIKLNEIEELIRQDQKNQVNNEYQQMLTQADNAFLIKNYSIARFYYNKALGIKPNEKYPAEQLRRIKDELLNR